MVLLASWCALRFGELTELRRRDIDIDMEARRGVIHVERGWCAPLAASRWAHPRATRVVATWRSPRTSWRPSRSHLASPRGARPDALLFPAHHGGHLAQSTLNRHFYKAREVAGRPDLRFHDLRHTGAVLAALRGHTGRTDGTAGSFHPSGGTALSARGPGPRSGDRREAVQARPRGVGPFPDFLHLSHDDYTGLYLLLQALDGDVAGQGAHAPSVTTSSD